MHINRVILMGQVTDAVTRSGTYSVFGLRVGDVKFPVYVFDPAIRDEIARTLSPGATVQVDGCLAFDTEVQGGRQYVAVTSDRACQVRLAESSVFSAGVPSLANGKDAHAATAAGEPRREPATRETPPREPGRREPAPVAATLDPATDRPAPPAGSDASRPTGAAATPGATVADGKANGTGSAPPAPPGSQPRPARPRMGGIAALPPVTPDPPGGDGPDGEDDDPIPF